MAVIAAPGLIALRDTPPLLANDHANAQLIAHGERNPAAAQQPFMLKRAESHVRSARLVLRARVVTCILVTSLAELAKLPLVHIDMAAIESNIVLWHLKPEAPPVATVLARVKEAGFIVGGMKGENKQRKCRMLRGRLSASPSDYACRINVLQCSTATGIVTLVETSSLCRCLPQEASGRSRTSM